MGSASSQVQKEEDIDATAKTLKHEETTPKTTKKAPRTYSKRKRPASPEREPAVAAPAAAQPLSSSTTQDKVGSAKRRRADKEKSADVQDLSGKENREPDTGAGSSEQEQEEESSSPPAKKQKAKPAAAASPPPRPPPTQKSKAAAKKNAKESSGFKVSRDGRIFQRSLEARLALPEQTFQPGHVSETNEKKTGWFSPEEIKTLERFKEDFCQENGLHADTFDQFIQSSTRERVELFKRHVSHMTVLEFWNSVYLRIPHRDRRSIARFMRRHFVAGCRPYNWTPHDDDELERLHRIHGPKWSIVANEMERTQDDVVQRWKNKVEHRSTMNRGAWSKEEVDKLIEVIEKSRGFLAAEQSFEVGKDIYEMDDKFISWGAVSDFFGHTRSRQQCADKWRKVRNRVVEARQEGNKDATYLEVYDFSIPIPMPRLRSKPDRPRRKKLSDDFVNSEEEEEEEEEEGGGEQVEEQAASGDDNLSALGRLPAQTFARDEEDISTQEVEDEKSANTTRHDHDHHHHHHSYPENDDKNDDNNNNRSEETRTQVFTPINPPLQQPPQPSSPAPASTPQKHKRSKRSKAEKAAAKAAKAAAKEERKKARRAQKRAKREEQKREEREREHEVYIKRESTSSGISIDQLVN